MTLRLVQLLLALTVAAFVVATGYTSSLISERQAALRAVSRYNVVWTINQALVELTRLQQRLAEFRVPGSGTGVDEVGLRLDILLGRTDTLLRGNVEEYLRGHPQRVEMIERLNTTLNEAVPLVARLQEPGAAEEVGRRLAPFYSDLASLASTARQFGDERMADDQEELQRLHKLFTAVAAGLILCGVALVGLLLWNNRLLVRAHDRRRRLAEDLERASAALELQNQRFEAALSNMSQGLLMFGPDRRLVVGNQRFGKMFRLPADEMAPGVPFDDIVARAGTDDPLIALEQIASQQTALIDQGLSCAFVQEHADGRSFQVHHEALPDGGWIATYEDISERRQAELQIIHMAHHDPLTDFANRVLFRQKLEEAVVRARREGTSLAIFCLDLDRFKDINDTLGHHIGDEVLKAVAARLAGCVREGDVIARLGGDEFAVLLPPSTRRHDCAGFARRLIAAVGAPYLIEGTEVTTGLSIGIAEFREAADGPDQLLKQADLALYRAKAEGRATYRFFQTAMDVELQARKELEADLHKALRNGELEMHYQPILDVASASVRGFEALMRWRHPERGMVPPSEFIPVAEDIGLIGTLGEWALRQACADAAAWPRDIKVAVNLSPAQFRNRGLANIVVNALAATGMSPARLELEITESVLLDQSEENSTVLHQLRDLGVHIAMDDFGTGYSSLSNLRKFPFDKIKIDQTFVRDLSANPESLTIVRLVIALGTSLGMTTTAEGVETEAEYLELKAAGCGEVQGYYFGRPQPASSVAAQLSAERIRASAAGSAVARSAG